ncbi:MAG TPA: fatty acid desaturase [Rhizomicrobium sp.]
MIKHNVRSFPKIAEQTNDIVSLKPRTEAILPAASLSEPSAARWLGALAADYAIVGLAMAAAYSAFAFAQKSGFAAMPLIGAVVVIVLAVIIIGTRQHAIMILAHDGSHGQVSRNRRLNDLLTNLLSLWPFGVGLSGYRKFHFAHHRYMGTDADPEYIHKKKSAPAYDLPATPGHIVRLALTGLFGEGSDDQIYFIVYVMARDNLRDKAAPVLVWGAIGLVLWHFNAWWVAALWFSALATSFGAVFRLRVWTEHVGTAGVHRISARWIYRVLFVPHNTWCHFEHHRFPSVPFWNLPKARALDTATPVGTLEALFSSYAGYDVVPSGEIAKGGGRSEGCGLRRRALR